jgi:hypothetical protein
MARKLNFSGGDTRGQVVVYAYAQVKFADLRTSAVGR